MTDRPSQEGYAIGMGGLGVMGRNLVLNKADVGTGHDKGPQLGL